VLDDFGDVYGISLAITGESYSYKELNDYVDYLRREIELVEGVSKVAVSGKQKEQVSIEISMQRLTSLGISPDSINNTLANQNVVSDAGGIKIGDDYIRIHPTGEFTDVAALGDLIINEAGTLGLIYLRDVANIERNFQEVPDNLVTFNGAVALNVGISFVSGVNVVEIDKNVFQRLDELKSQQPLGIEIGTVYSQPDEVEQSVRGFIVSLGQAVAIVVVEGILIGIQKGRTRIQAAGDIVNQTKWPLLGATVIAVAAFAPIGLSQDATGEYLRYLVHGAADFAHAQLVYCHLINAFLCQYIFC